MTTLLDIGSEMVELLSLLEVNGGELSPELEAALDAVALNEAEKLDQYVDAISELEARVEACKVQRTRFLDRGQVAEKSIARLLTRLGMYMNQTRQKRLVTQLHTISWHGNGGKWPIEVPADPKTLPTEYQSVTVAADKDKIAEALMNKIDVPGCKLLPRGTHLRIS